jgi:hypothetical protein
MKFDEWFPCIRKITNFIPGDYTNGGSKDFDHDHHRHHDHHHRHGHRKGHGYGYGYKKYD